MDRLGVGHGDDLVALHDVQADPRHAGVGLVVDKQVFAVVAAIGGGQVRVMAITVLVLGALAEDALALVGQAPAGGRIDVEYRDAHQLAHRRHTQHPHFALVAAAPETVVLVQLTRAHMDLRLRFLGRRRKGLAGKHRTADGRGACQHRAGHGAGAEEATPAHAFGLRCGPGFFDSLSFMMCSRWEKWVPKAVIQAPPPAPPGSIAQGWVRPCCVSCVC